MKQVEAKLKTKCSMPTNKISSITMNRSRMWQLESLATMNSMQKSAMVKLARQASTGSSLCLGIITTRENNRRSKQALQSRTIKHLHYRRKIWPKVSNGLHPRRTQIRITQVFWWTGVMIRSINHPKSVLHIKNASMSIKLSLISTIKEKFISMQG